MTNTGITDTGGQTTPRAGTAKKARSFIIPVDCLETENGSLFGPQSEGGFLLRLGSLLAGVEGGRLLLCSVVPVPQGESVSAYSLATKARRQELERLAEEALAGMFAQHDEIDEHDSQSEDGAEKHASPSSRYRSVVSPVVRVATETGIAHEVRSVIESEPDALVLLPMQSIKRDECPWLAEALRKPLPCDLVWARPPISNAGAHGLERNMSILVPARGGPQAALALELSQDLMEGLHAEVTVLHVLQDLPERERASEEAPFGELLARIANSDRGVVTPRRAIDMAQKPVETITEAAEDYQMLIMGAGGQTATEMGSFTEKIAKSTQAALMVVRTRLPVGPAIRAARKRARPHVLDPETLSLIVDKWFAENTFHAEEYSDLSKLVDIKRKRGVTISVGLPALNEEATIGPIIEVLRTAFMQDVPLVDEIVLIDSNSEDNTREIAREMGIPVYIHQEVLPEAGEPVAGKGEALWKSLHVLKGDIIAWVDTDVSNMDPQFVYGLVGPLLREPRIGYVKGYYHRPIQSGTDLLHEGGGRVTELTVRPLVNLFFPLLSGLVQPLAGEYAGRREVLEQLPFFSGYGVETGLLIDLLEQFGLAAIGQVNLERRVHRNRSLADLSLTAFAIVQVLLTRLQERAQIKLLEELNSSMKLIRFEEDHLSLEVRRVKDVQRPPIATIPAYRKAHPEK